MIKANELRIGNLVFDEYGAVTIMGRILPSELHHKNEFNPIPITPKILILKAGFDAISPRLYRKYLTQDEILWDGSEITLRNHNQRFELNVKCIYVHQLQNIVFALTAEELEINL